LIDPGDAGHEEAGAAATVQGGEPDDDEKDIGPVRRRDAEASGSLAGEHGQQAESHADPDAPSVHGVADSLKQPRTINSFYSETHGTEYNHT
jgi:hypothetical protein